MIDWKSAAQVLGVPIPADDIERVTAPLAPLEPLIKDSVSKLRGGTESAVVFDPAPEDSWE